MNFKALLFSLMLICIATSASALPDLELRDGERLFLHREKLFYAQRPVSFELVAHDDAATSNASVSSETVPVMGGFVHVERFDSDMDIEMAIAQQNNRLRFKGIVRNRSEIVHSNRVATFRMVLPLNISKVSMYPIVTPNGEGPAWGVVAGSVSFALGFAPGSFEPGLDRVEWDEETRNVIVTRDIQFPEKVSENNPIVPFEIILFDYNRNLKAPGVAGAYMRLYPQNFESEEDVAGSDSSDSPKNEEEPQQ